MPSVSEALGSIPSTTKQKKKINKKPKKSELSSCHALVAYDTTYHRQKLAYLCMTGRKFPPLGEKGKNGT
jgi:hypothetical protein